MEQRGIDKLIEILQSRELRGVEKVMPNLQVMTPIVRLCVE
jgi:hypothetical protein